MSQVPHVIGEGSYGCVHKPSLKCKKKSNNLSKKISKFMLKRHAEDEMKEYETIEKIDDTKKYYLGNPILCTPEQSKQYDSAVRKCDLYEKYKSNKSKFALLVMKDGGDNLSIYPKTNFENNVEFTKKFWVEALRLFKGIHEFEKHGISHHDLKPQNIVYNENKNRLNIIDFGFMRKINDTVENCSNDEYYIAEYPFWSYPFEFAYLNKEKFMKVAKMSISEKTILIKQLIHEMNYDKESKIHISSSLFFNYITQQYNREKKIKTISKYIEDFENMILYEITVDNYDTFVKKSISTIDLFALGISFQYLLCYCKKMDSNIFDDLEECFYKMMTPSVVNRHTIIEALYEFQNILKKHDWIESNKVKIKTNKADNKYLSLSLNKNKKNYFLEIQEDLKIKMNKIRSIHKTRKTYNKK